MSWFRKKPAEINVTELLSRKEYFDDFVAAQQAADAKLRENPMLEQLAGCLSIQQKLMEEAQRVGSSDPTSLLLHSAFMVCAGNEVAPALAQTFQKCAQRNRGRPDLCDKEYTRMWDGVLTKMTRSDNELKKDLLSEVEEEVILDCKMLKESADSKLQNGLEEEGNAELERWMRCTVPNVCEEQWSLLQACMDRNGGKLDVCLEEGRPLIRCVSDFTIRYGRSLQ